MTRPQSTADGSAVAAGVRRRSGLSTEASRCDPRPDDRAAADRTRESTHAGVVVEFGSPRGGWAGRAAARNTGARPHWPATASPGGERRTGRGCGVALVVRARALSRFGAAHRVRVDAGRSAGRLRQCCGDGGDPDRVASGVDGPRPAGRRGRTGRDRQRPHRSRSCHPWQRARLVGVAGRPRRRSRAPSSEAGVGEPDASHPGGGSDGFSRFSRCSGLKVLEC